MSSDFWNVDFWAGYFFGLTMAVATRPLSDRIWRWLQRRREGGP